MLVKRPTLALAGPACTEEHHMRRIETALITGASRGLGKHGALALAAKGEWNLENA